MDLLVAQSSVFSTTLSITHANPKTVNSILDTRKDWLNAMCMIPDINRAIPIFSTAERVRSWLILYIYFTC